MPSAHFVNAIKQPLISNGTQLITQLIFLFPVPYSLFPVPYSLSQRVNLILSDYLQ
jgi:hypothetical protein